MTVCVCVCVCWRSYYAHPNTVFTSECHTHSTSVPVLLVRYSVVRLCQYWYVRISRYLPFTHTHTHTHKGRSDMSHLGLEHRESEEEAHISELLLLFKTLSHMFNKDFLDFSADDCFVVSVCNLHSSNGVMLCVCVCVYIYPCA